MSDKSETRRAIEANEMLKQLLEATLANGQRLMEIERLLSRQATAAHDHAKSPAWNKDQGTRK